MITLFNRKELVITRSMQRQAQIRQMLSEAGIEYSLKTRGANGDLNRSAQRRLTGSAGISPEQQYEYTFYVRKSDFEQALHIIER